MNKKIRDLKPGDITSHPNATGFVNRTVTKVEKHKHGVWITWDEGKNDSLTLEYLGSELNEEVHIGYQIS